MSILVYLVVAATVGWIATVMLHEQSALFANMLVAVLGAFVAGNYISPLFKVSTIGDAFTIPTMLVALLGSIVLLAFANLFRRLAF